jgi:hypothetical protein
LTITKNERGARRSRRGPALGKIITLLTGAPRPPPSHVDLKAKTFRATINLPRSCLIRLIKRNKMAGEVRRCLPLQYLIYTKRLGWGGIIWSRTPRIMRCTIPPVMALSPATSLMSPDNCPFYCPSTIKLNGRHAFNMFTVGNCRTAVTSTLSHKENLLRKFSKLPKRGRHLCHHPGRENPAPAERAHHHQLNRRDDRKKAESAGVFVYRRPGNSTRIRTDALHGEYSLFQRKNFESTRPFKNRSV